MKGEKILRRAAIHEAGHAVIAETVAGLRVRSLIIGEHRYRGRDLLGRVTFANNCPGRLLGVMCLAGVMAESLYKALPWDVERRLNVCDRDAFAFEKAVPDEEEHAALILLTMDLVRQHKAEIFAVADLGPGKHSGKVVRRVIEQASRRNSG